MTPQEFAQDAKNRIEKAGYKVGYEHTFTDGTVYLASLETVKGCMGQPQAEAQMYPDGHIFYTFNIRQ